MQDRLGMHLKSSRVNTRGLSTRPCTSKEYVAASTTGAPKWCREKCKSEGVMTPLSAPSGVVAS
jgi:hypothetical protein